MPCVVLNSACSRKPSRIPNVLIPNTRNPNTGFRIARTVLVPIAAVSSLALSSLAMSWTLWDATVRAADKPYEQVPEIVASAARGEKPQEKPGAEKKPAAESQRPNFQEGPAPTWIWGSDQNRNYHLTVEFSGKFQAGWLKASCDNQVTIVLNGTTIGRCEEWQSPVELDLRKHLREGSNQLRMESRNEGGPAALIAKLVLRKADGSKMFVVSDGAWKAIEAGEGKTPGPVKELGKLGVQPWGNVFDAAANLTAGDRGVFQVPPGFQIERLFTVPKDQLGSWVSIAFDPKGRLLASDQEGKGICRITLPPLGSKEPTKVEKLDLNVSSAQGMLCAFDSLYLSINGGPGSGLYRARDTNGDDQYDELVKLASFRGGGEHGPHGLRLSPDGKSIYVACGNHTDPPEKMDASRVPTPWDEDLLLPRQWDANGHAVGRMAPGGWIAKTDPDGKRWEIVSVGYRNEYDLAFNAEGELFSYDSDMEWDLGMPWYRPTRVTHSTSGSEFGWRSGTGKWPPYYVDSLPPLLDIGPGSPVGIAFGYGAKFPARYQNALYICDWTFGTMYALHLKPEGASYRAEKEEFVARTPLPLTDVAIGPDGAMYFTVGGRGTQSELFRVTYQGTDPVTPVDGKDREFADLRALRRTIEAMHAPAADSAAAVKYLWPLLGHADRHIRYAARVALEHQDLAAWRERIHSENTESIVIAAAVALARQGKASDKPNAIAALKKIDFAKLNEAAQLDYLRAWSLVFIRLGPMEKDDTQAVAKTLDAHFPGKSAWVNRELCNVLVYLQSPTLASKAVALLRQPDAAGGGTQAELLARNPGYGNTIRQMMENQPDAQKLHYAFALRNLRAGWTIEDRKTYFAWFNEARKKTGGASYQGFLRNIDRDAYDNATEAERLAVEVAGSRQPYKAPQLPMPQGPGKDWNLETLLPLGAAPLKGRNFDNGKKMFAAARCVICHRFDGDGGATGPDLTQLAGRFNYKDLSEAIVDPSKVVSDQYRASVAVLNDGKVHTGRVVGDSPAAIKMLVDPEDPTKVIDIPKETIDEIRVSPVSVMPKDLLKPLNQDEVLDLLAYLLSRGNRNDGLFRN